MDSQSCPLVKMQQVNKSYGGVLVLNRAHFLVNKGEIHGLVGENGAGKSTLVKILAGEVQRDQGQIIWLDRPVSLASRVEADRLGITMIHQELNLAPHLTVSENIFLGHETTHFAMIDRRKETSEARSLLERLGFDLSPHAVVGSLSLAEKQLVEIARAVASSNKLVIMDEPTSSLSAREVEVLFRVVRQLKREGASIIFVTHRLEELAQIADAVTVLRDGETVREGPMPRRDFGDLIRAMVGRELEDFFSHRAVPDESVTSGSRRKAALEVRNLSRQRKSAKRGFWNISFSINSGEIVGLAGLVGAGRTELAEALFGINPADGGQIFINGREALIRSPQTAIRRGIALLTEDRKRTGLALNLSMAENITLANLSALVRNGMLNLKKEKQVTRDFAGRLRIRTHSFAQKAARLSGGNQQKVVLAKWLFRRPRILIFDEPTRGVDVGAKAEIYGLIRELAESGVAILMISSELPEILGMTHRVLVMRDGRLVRELNTAETSQEEIMKHAALASLPTAS